MNGMMCVKRLFSEYILIIFYWESSIIICDSAKKVAEVRLLGDDCVKAILNGQLQLI